MSPRVRLGHSPLEVAPLGVGCWVWGDREYWLYEQAHGPREVVAAFEASRAAGLDLFDTAEAYGWGKSEQLLGALVRRGGPGPLVATKYAPLAGRGGARALAKGIDGSLKRLGLPRIDLYQMHWADSQEISIAAAMEVLASAVKGGRIGAVGVSNYRAGEMREAHAALARRGVPLAVNQVKYSLLHRGPEVDGVLEACRELGATLLAYSPLEQGILTGKYRPGARPEGPRGDTPWFAAANLAAAQPVLSLLHELAARHQVDQAAIALAWLIAQPGVVPLAGARDGDQAAANARALAVRLGESELAELDAVSRPWRVAG